MLSSRPTIRAARIRSPSSRTSFREQVPRVEIDPDRRTAIYRAIGLAEPGDVVVIAGKGHEQGQEIDGEKLPFDDKVVAREALRA